jgi:hypothetical protein
MVAPLVIQAAGTIAQTEAGQAVLKQSGEILKPLLKKYFELMMAVPSGMRSLAMLLVVLIFFVFLYIIGRIIHYLIYVQHPRRFWFSKYQNLDAMDKQIIDSVASALAAYTKGIQLTNHLTSTDGDYPNIYSVSPEQLGNILNKVQGRINFHTNSELYKYLKSITKDVTTIEALTDFFKEQLTERNPELLRIIARSEKTLIQNLKKMDEHNVFNFIDYSVYNRKTPRPGDDATLKKYGKIIVFDTLPAKAVFKDLNSEDVESLLPHTRDEVNTALDDIKQRRAGLIDNIANVPARLRKAMNTKVLKDKLQQASADLSQKFEKAGDALMSGLTKLIKVDPARDTVSTGVTESNLIEEILKNYEAIIAALKNVNTTSTITPQQMTLFQEDYFVVIERATKLRYDRGLGKEFMLDKKERDLIVDIYIEVIGLFQIQFYRQQINDAVFLTLYWYFGDKTKFMSHMTELSNFYFSFHEILLYAEHEKHTKPFRIWRNIEGKDVMNLYMNGVFLPNLNLYIKEKIIKGIWIPFFKFLDTNKKSIRLWDRLVNRLQNPCTFTNVLRKCPERFEAFQQTKDDQQHKPEVKEHFFGGIVRMLSGVVRMVKALMQVIPGIVKIVLLFLRQPLQAIKELIGVVLFFIVQLYIILFSLPSILFLIPLPNATLGSVLLFAFLYIAKFPLAVFHTTLNVLIFSAIVVTTGIIALFDSVVTKGKALKFVYRAFGACENAPDQWYTRGSSHLGNKFERRFLFCMRPCGSMYQPSMGGFACSRVSKNVPNQCPQAIIMRMSQHMSVKSPYILTNRIPSGDWGNLSFAEKVRMVNNMANQKAEYYRQCSTTMGKGGYDDIAKNICRNIDVIAKDKKERKMLYKVCQQAYCRNGKLEPFCYRYQNVKMTDDDVLGDQNIVIRALVYTSLIIGLTTAVYYMQENQVLKL